MLLYILSKNKLTETFLFMNTFVFVVCFNSFPSIRFLICVGKLPFARVPSCDSLPILPHRFHFCQAFLIPFSKYFFAFSSGFLALRPSRQPLAQFACLSYHFYQTKSKKYDRWVKLTSMRSGQPGINSQEYSGYPIAITGKVEQDIIAGFFQMLDNRIAVQNKIIKHRKSLIFSLVIEILLSFLSLIESALSLNVFSFFNNLLKFMWTIFKEVKRLWSRKKT